jgi:hypothetical protein
MERKLSCDRWGTLTLTITFEDGNTHAFILGHVESSRWRVPPGLDVQYRRLLDEYRDGFDPRAEQLAAFNIAKGLA